jgi:hypothetical protein
VLLGTAVEQRHPDDRSPHRSSEAVGSTDECLRDTPGCGVPASGLGRRVLPRRRGRSPRGRQCVAHAAVPHQEQQRAQARDRAGVALPQHRRRSAPVPQNPLRANDPTSGFQPFGLITARPEILPSRRSR